MNKIALVEVGDQAKENYLFIKGEPPEEKESADIYWYEDDISIEEIQQELEDLKENYDIVGIILPVPQQIERVVL